MLRIGDEVRVTATTDDPAPLHRLDEDDEGFGIRTGLVGRVRELNGGWVGIEFPGGPKHWYLLDAQVSKVLDGFVPLSSLNDKR